MDPNARFLKATITALEKHSRTVADKFGPLSSSQLNWQPDPKAWSVGVILDHLVVTNRSYFPVFKEIAGGTYRPKMWTRISPLSKVLGRTMVKSLGPDPKRTYTSPPAFRPGRSQVDHEIVELFHASQLELLDIVKQMEGMDLGKIWIPSPASSFLTYSAWHALRIIEVHEARHLQQATRVMENPEFPSE